MIYCHAVLPRSGLGNRLFPWARCRIFSYVNDIPMLAPRWTQIKVGPLLRGESDLRFYHNLFKRRPEQIGGMKKIWLLLFSKKLPEPEDLCLYKKGVFSGNVIVVFKGEKGYFGKLNGWDQFLMKELLLMTKDRWLNIVYKVPDIPIGIHVRRGDFTTPVSEEDFMFKGSLRTPILWFIKSLKVIRENIGFPAKAFVTSDGTVAELQELLNLENVFLIRTGSAISDMLILSKAKVLIASGGSTFSAWASFLGQMPTISHPGQSLTWFNLKNRKGYYVGEFNPDDPPQPFIEQTKIVLSEFKS